MKHEDWEYKVNKAKKENYKLLEGFKTWLSDKGLKSKTILAHEGNIDFFINEFLLYYDVILPEDGVGHIGSFLSDFFVRKAMWANVSSLKQNITSLKKFYTYLNESKRIDDKKLRYLNFYIKEEKDYWIKNVKDYSDDLDLDIW